MKKILLANLLIFLFLLCNVSYAEYHDPIYEPFEGYVSNNSGADYYSKITNSEFKIINKLNYNEEIEILEEQEFDGVLYGKIIIEEKEYYIKINDITPLDKNYSNISEEQPREIVIISDNGVKLRKGPSEKYYSEILTIPKGTKLKGYFAKDNEMKIYWVYVEYNNQKGWINCNNGDVGYCYNLDFNILTINKTDIFADLKMQKKLSQIQAYTIINSKDIVSLDSRNFFRTEEFKNDFKISNGDITSNNYIKFNNSEGYIFIDEYGLECDETYTVESDQISLYKEPNDSSKVLVENIPVKTELHYNYYSSMGRLDGNTWEYGYWAYTEYNGQKGWIQVLNNRYVEQKTQVLESFDKAVGIEEIQDNSNVKLYILIALVILLIVLVIILIKRIKSKNK